jgi:hypothetical protein
MFKSKIHKFITQNPIFLKFIYGIIILNVLSVVLSSYKEIHHQYETHFNYFELVSIIIFSLEYIIRLWTSDIEYKTGTPITKRIKFFFSSVGLIDLFAILPFYLPALRSVACSSMVSDLEAHKDKTKTDSDNVRRSYGYKYDDLNRLLKGIYQRGTDPNNTLVLQDLLTNLCQKNQ